MSIFDMNEIKEIDNKVKIKPKEKFIDLNDYIPKKLAALEVYKWLNQLKILSVMSFIGFIITLLAYSFSSVAGLGAAAVFSFATIYFLFRSTQEMKRLEYTYKIDPPKPIIKFQQQRQVPK